MTGQGDGYPQWGPPPGGPGPQYNQYNQPYYPPPPPPPPQQPYYPPPPGYQQYPPPPPPPGYGPPPVVIPIEGKGAAKLAAKMNKRSLVIGPEGFAHDGKNGAFRLGWPELRRIVIATAYHQDSVKVLAPKIWRVRVIMDAADPGFSQRHPEIAGLQGKYGGSGPGSYGLPLGPVPNIVPQLAQALAAFGGPLFGGVVEEGQVLGFTYL
jgi:hypothetical protein